MELIIIGSLDDTETKISPSRYGWELFIPPAVPEVLPPIANGDNELTMQVISFAASSVVQSASVIHAPFS